MGPVACGRSRHSQGNSFGGLAGSGHEDYPVRCLALLAHHAFLQIFTVN